MTYFTSWDINALMCLVSWGLPEDARSKKTSFEAFLKNLKNVYVKKLKLTKSTMYILISQLFLAITGHNIPEDAFDLLFPLLQGKRKGRNDICLGVTDYSRQTPHQILLGSIPCQFYQTWEQFLELKKNMRTKQWKNRYYLDRNTNIARKCAPVWESKTIWIDKTYEPMTRLNYILYMKSEEDKRVVLRNINQYGDIRGVDVSWMNCCVFCGEFMRQRSYSFKSDKSDIEKMCKQIHRFGYNYGESFERQQKANISGIPICSLCEGSKERQGKYRMNMLSRGDWGTFYHERDEQYHRNIGDMYDKPEITQIPSDLVSGNKTPLDCVITYWDLTDPLSDYFWHPDMTADEYMRWIEHTQLSHLNFNDVDPLDDDLWDENEENPESVVEDVIENIIQQLEV